MKGHNDFGNFMMLLAKQGRTPMTEDEIYQIFLDMMEERKVARKLPWEPSRMDFAMKVAKIAYERGYDDGCFQAT